MNKFIIHRTRIGKDIVAEFVPPIGKSALKEGRVALLLGGAPGMPGKTSLMEFLSKKGYFVVNPRYRGTWESGGVFLKDEPTVDIAEVIEAVRGGSLLSLYEEKSYSLPKKPVIHIFSSSFGGPAGFLLSKHPDVARVIAFSPVCDWKANSKVEPLETLNHFTKDVYGEGYRLSKQGWMKLAKGNFYNPAASLDRIDGKNILIFHARNDDVVPFNSVFDFAYMSGALLKATRSGGHMSLSEAMDPQTWQEIRGFLKASV